MECIGENSIASIETAPEQSYECPCGKAYRSYPALFTHIRNKHDGHPPGAIKKPILPPKKRGRPCAKKTISPPETTQNQPQIKEDTSQRQQIITPSLMNEALCKLLNTLPLQVASKSSLNEMGSVVEMSVFLITQQNSEGTLSMGAVVARFLRQVSVHVGWPHFSQVYALLMLLVQFIIEQRKDPLVLTRAPVDLLCDYVNNFLLHGLPRMARVYSLTNLAVLAPNILLPVLNYFFAWMMANQYTNYRISLAEQAQ